MVVRARLTPPRTQQSEWPWHKAKLSSLPVSLMLTGDRRMEAENFLASGYGTRVAVEAKDSGWLPLVSVAKTWQPSRLKGIQVSPEFGTPFLAATQVYDRRPAPRKWLSLERTDNVEGRFVKSGTLLLTCSGSVGRAILADQTVDGILVSHDLLRIESLSPDWWGWIYAYLRAPQVREMMKSAQYGHIIKHLEVSHLNVLPILKLKASLRSSYDKRAQRIIELRDQAHEKILEAEELYAQAVGPVSSGANQMVGYATKASSIFGGRRRLDGYRYNPVARAADEAVRSGGRKVERLDTLVKRIFVPGRFKHVYGPEGVPYLDSAQILEAAPDVTKRVLSLPGEKQAGYIVDSGTLLIPCSGQLHGIVGSVVLSAKWHEDKVLSNHIMRIVPKDNASIRTGYLQCVLGHPTLGRPRILRNAHGSSVPELGPDDVAELLVPRFEVQVEDAIAEAMELAAEWRSEADLIEDEIAAEADDYVTQFLAGKVDAFDM